MVQTSPIKMEALESEFIPPLEARDTWGMPWERQLSAVQAWQEAGANSDGEGSQWAESPVEMIVPALEDAAMLPHYGRSGGSGTGGTELTMRTIVRMNTLLVSLRERMLQITTEASNIAIAEMALRQQGTTADMPGTPDASAGQPALSGHNAQRIADLVHSWYEVMAAAQRSMTGLTGLSPTGEAVGGREAVSEASYPLTERRHHALAIDFPERRRKAG